MPINIVLVQHRQTPKGTCLSWSSMEEVAGLLVFVCRAKLTPEELEAAVATGGGDDCLVLRAGPEQTAVLDDLTPAGEARYYGVAMRFTDGAVRTARFRVLPEPPPAGAAPLSSLAQRAAAGPARPASVRAAPPAAAFPAGRPVPSAAAARPEAAAPRAGPATPEDPLEARKRAQREARARMEAQQARSPAPAAETSPSDATPPSATPIPFPEPTPEPAAAAPEPAPPAEDPLEARKRAQREARARIEGGASAQAPAAAPAPAAVNPAPAAPAAPASPPPPPSSVPLTGRLALRMQGGTQTWDGLRITWEASARVAAWELIVSDHQLFEEEVADALAGRADFTTAAAFAPSVDAVIDNVTPREARGWYALLARSREGERTPHPFRVGDAAASGRPVAPFLNPNRTGELRAEVEELLGQAREQLARWTSEQDRGARREAQRLVGDALLMYPGYPAAQSLRAEVG